VTSAVHGDWQFVAGRCYIGYEGGIRLRNVATHGTISELDGSAKGWISYIEGLEYYLPQTMSRKPGSDGLFSLLVAALPPTG